MDTVAARPGFGRQSWNFTRHFLEMCVSMCAGGVTLYVLLFAAGPALIGYADPRLQLPELSVLAIALFFTVPMALWMRFRGMAWRPILEMSGAAMGVALLLIGLGWLGILSQAGLREFAGPAFCGPACVAMFGAMLFRLDLYTGLSGHHMAHAGHAA
jgi:hypothetical protein